MIRTLQRKFIVTAMIAVTVLLLVLLGAVNAVNAWTSRQETRRLLDSLVQMHTGDPRLQREDQLFRPQLPQQDPAATGSTVEAEAPEQTDDPDDFDDFDDWDDWEDAPLWEDGGQLPPQQFGDRPGGFLSAPLTEDDRLAAVYFTADRAPDGTLTVDLSRISSVTQTEAETLAAQAAQSGGSQGSTGSFRYSSGLRRDGSRVYVFLENSTRRTAVLRVVALSVLAGLVGWGLMLLLVVLLSKRAIAPIAANMERQRQFVTDAGHELKTPLAIIQANTEAMELIQGENKWTRNIKAQVQRLTELTRNLLTLARAEEPAPPGEDAPLDFSDLVGKTAGMFREPMELRGLALDQRVEPGLTVRGSTQQLTSLCSILLDNAVKYALPDSRVELELLAQDRQAVLRLENRCSALPDCPPDRLFDRFYRADAARTQGRQGGFGIGLSAARVIAQQHRGSLRAEYPAPDRIAFVLSLPKE